MLYYSFINISKLLEDQNIVGVTYITQAKSYRSYKEYYTTYLDNYIDKLEEAVNNNKFKEKDNKALQELLT